jgi:hypothetical protein
MKALLEGIQLQQKEISLARQRKLEVRQTFHTTYEKFVFKYVSPVNYIIHMAETSLTSVMSCQGILYVVAT